MGNCANKNKSKADVAARTYNRSLDDVYRDEKMMHSFSGSSLKTYYQSPFDTAFETSPTRSISLDGQGWGAPQSMGANNVCAEIGRNDSEMARRLQHEEEEWEQWKASQVEGYASNRQGPTWGQDHLRASDMGHTDSALARRLMQEEQDAQEATSLALAQELQNDIGRAHSVYRTESEAIPEQLRVSTEVSMNYEDLLKLPTVEVGLTQGSLSALPKVHWQQSLAGTEEEAQCMVCLTGFENGEVLLQLPCNHLYHSDCIKPWLELHVECPTCRKPIPGMTQQITVHHSADFMN